MPSSSTEGSPEKSRGALGLACERCAGGPPTRPTELVAEALLMEGVNQAHRGLGR